MASLDEGGNRLIGYDAILLPYRGLLSLPDSVVMVQTGCKFSGWLDMRLPELARDEYRGFEVWLSGIIFLFGLLLNVYKN